MSQNAQSNVIINAPAEQAESKPDVMTLSPDQIKSAVIKDGTLEITLNDSSKIEIKDAEQFLASKAPSAGVISEMIDGKSAAVIEPAAGAPVVLIPGQVKELAINKEDIADMKIDNGQLTITLKDGTIIVVSNYKEAIAGDLPAQLTLADGTVITMDMIMGRDDAAKVGESDEGIVPPSDATLEKAENAENAAKEIDQAVADAKNAAKLAAAAEQEMADIAEKLAEVEPAAGGAGGGGGGRGGYGFSSSADVVTIANLNAIGPIGPTELRYGVENRYFENPLINDIEQEPADLPPPTIIVTFPPTDGGDPDGFPVQVDGDTGLVKEDGTLVVNVNVNLPNNGDTIDGDEVLTIVISGIDPTWGNPTPSDYTGVGGPVSWTETSPGTFEITLPRGQDYNGTITFTPPAQSDSDHPAINIDASVYDPDLDDTSSSSATIDIVTDAVADQPDVDADDASTFIGHPLNVDIQGMLGVDLDGSEEITEYQVSGVPNGFAFNQGTDLGGGFWSFTPDQIIGLQITPPADFVGSLDLIATVYNEEVNISDNEVDFSDNTNSDSDPFVLTWVDGPAITYDFSNEVDGNTGLVKEDSSVTLSLNVDLPADQIGPVAGDEVLTVTISNLDPAWAINLPGQSGAVWTATGTPGQFSITLPAGQSYSGNLTFAPPADSDLDHPTFNISATVYDPALDLSATDTAQADIITDAVIDAPTLSASDTGGEEGTIIPLNITTAITETANISETITQVTVSGLPTGATLTAGTYNSGTDTWVLDVIDLPGLGINVPNGVTGHFELTVTSTAAENVQPGDAPANQEVDYTDNVQTVTTTLDLCITADDVPVITAGNVSVDEGNFDTSATLVANGTLNVNFGADTPGTIQTNLSVPTGLTSNGHAVSVIGVNNIYTATDTVTNDVVFKLTLGVDGGYTYEQYITLDHAEGTARDDAFTMTFGVTATDNEGDMQETTLDVTVNDDAPIANNDFNKFDSNAGSTSGNVITGENGALDTTDSDIDDPSNDEPNTVTNVRFDGVDYAVPATGTVEIEGQYGVLRIDATGSYTYELKEGATPAEGKTFSFTPTAADVDGIQQSITSDGITIGIKSFDSNYDLVWADEGAGAGIGMDNRKANDAPKVWPVGERIGVTFSEGVTKTTITIGDIGLHDNEGLSGLHYEVIYTDGTTQTHELHLVPNNNDGVLTDGEIDNGVIKFTIDACGCDGKLISSLRLFPANGEYKAASFVVQSVEATTATEKMTDQFTYTLTDGDGDTDTANLTFCSQDMIDDVPVITVTNISVDEGNFDTLAVLSQNGTLSVDFGADVAGSVVANGTAPTGLTSMGQVVTITNTESVYTGKNEGGETVFTLTLNPDGTYSYQQFLTLDHPDTADHNDALVLNFGVTATDGDADASTATIQITVLDDGLSANDDLNKFDSNAGSTSGNVITGVNGALDTTDTDVDDQSNDHPNTVISVAGVTIPTDGSSVNIIGVYGVLSINKDGVYTYTLNPGPATTVSEDFSYTLQDGDGDTDNAILKITAEDMIDDKPCLKVTNVCVDETSFDTSAVLTQSGTVTATFGADVPGVIKANGTGPTGLTSMGAAVTVTHSESVFTGKANGATVFTLTLNGDGTYTYNQFKTLDHPNTGDHNDSLLLKFGVRVTDGDGDMTLATIKVTVLDDGLTAHDDYNSFNASACKTSGNVITGSNGTFDKTVNDKDDLSNDTPNTVSKVGSVSIPTSGANATIIGTYGVLTINKNGAYTYTLNKNVKTSDTYCFTPKCDDAKGIQKSVTHDGITIAVKNAGQYDLTWVQTADGKGLGIDNLSDAKDSPKAWPTGETFQVSYAHGVSATKITIGDIGDNNDDGAYGIDYTVKFVDGTTYSGEQRITANNGGVQSEGEVKNGYVWFDLKSSDFGGKLISSVDITSVNAGSYKGASFLLSGVTATAPVDGPIVDKFEYTLKDADGDTSTAVLIVDAQTGSIIDTATGAGDGNDIVFAANKLSGIVNGYEGSDIFLFLSENDPVKHIGDFNKAEGDKLDLSGMLEQYDDVSSAIGDFVKFTTSGGNTTVSVDVNGAQGGSNFVNIAILDGQTGLNVDDLKATGHLIV